VDIQAQLSMNQSRAEEITLREDYGALNLPHHDEGFGDFNEDAPELMRDADTNSNIFGDHGGSSAFAEHSIQRSGKEAPAIPDDGFGAPLTNDMMGMISAPQIQNVYLLVCLKMG